MSDVPLLTRLRQIDDKIYRGAYGLPWIKRLHVLGAAVWVVVGLVQAARGEPGWLVYAALAVLYVALFLRGQRPSS